MHVEKEITSTNVQIKVGWKCSNFDSEPSFLLSWLKDVVKLDKTFEDSNTFRPCCTSMFIFERPTDVDIISMILIGADVKMNFMVCFIENWNWPIGDISSFKSEPNF